MKREPSTNGREHRAPLERHRGRVGLLLTGIWVYSYFGYVRTPWRLDRFRETISFVESMAAGNDGHPVATFFERIALAHRQQIESEWFLTYAVVYGAIGLAASALYGIASWETLRRGKGAALLVIMTAAIVALGLVKPTVRYLAWSFPPFHLLGSVTWPVLSLAPLLFVAVGLRARKPS